MSSRITIYPATGEQAFLDADHTKLNGIEAEAKKYPDTGEQAFLDADHTKLNGIEAEAKKYPDTGEQAFLDADHTKLDGLFDVRGKLVFVSPTELTISGGAITVTQTRHTLDTEGNGASDDLVTINGGANGQILIINTVSESRDVVLKAFTGNLDIPSDITLNYPYTTLMLVHQDGYWSRVY